MANTYLEYLGVTGPENVLYPVDRGDGVLGTYVPDWFAIALPVTASIESVILSIIGADTTILGLLPIGKFATGLFKLPALPYCTINQEGGAPSTHTNTSRFDRDLMRFQIRHENHAEGKQIQTALAERFDNLSINLTFGGVEKSVLYARVENKFAIEDPDAVWQFLIDISFWSEGDATGIGVLDIEGFFVVD